ncbi:hypothetical protein [Fibrobacter succinogenes]|uniref:hypothetical protein n=1 Tax=Fibrobacter succinogenes TaxID=833 RepID=UPI001569CA23|nr:hypothetical protein [Fibrobacter succinogenes]
MSSNNILPQTSGDLSIVHYADAQGNENFFIRAWAKGSKVLIPLKEVMDDVNSSIENIKKLIPEGTSEQNPHVNNLKLYKELHRVPNGGTLLAGAKVGDILWVDPENGDKYFFDKAVYPVSQAVADGLESVGVVADVDGRKLLILHKDESTDLQFANCWLFKVTGIHLDGTTNTLNMQQHASNDSAVPAGTFTDNMSTTLAEFCTALDTWLREHQTVAGASETNWHCELMPDADGVDSCFIVVDTNRWQNRLSPIASGSTATAEFYMWQFVKQNTDRTTLLRNNGSNVYYAGWNKEQLIEWFSDQTHSSISPTDDPNGTGLLNKSDFEGSSYPNVKAAYNNDYTTYIEAMMMKWPSATGSQAVFDGTGPAIGAALGTHTHKNLSGETVYTFTANRYSYTRATEATRKSDDLGDGSWYLPDVVDSFKVFSKMKVDGTDAINDSLSEISSRRSLSVSRWCCSRSFSVSGWITHLGGHLNYPSFDAKSRVCAVALLEY